MHEQSVTSGLCTWCEFVIYTFKTTRDPVSFSDVIFFCRKILVAMYLNLLNCIKNPVDVSFVAIFIQTFVNYLILTLACLSFYLPWKCTFGTQSRVCGVELLLSEILTKKWLDLSLNYGVILAQMWPNLARTGLQKYAASLSYYRSAKMTA